MAWVVILLTAATLRFWRISWGLAEGTPFPDEQFFTAPAAGFVPLTWASFDPPNLIYPPLTGYLMGLGVALTHASGLASAPVARKAPQTILVSRCVGALLAVATVAIVGLAAKRMYSAGAGLAAAGLMAVVPLHAMDTHVANPDVVLTACSALTLLLVLPLASSGSAWAAAAAAFAAGLAFTAKYTGLAMIVPVGWAILEHAARTRRLKKALLAGVVAIAAYLATLSVFCLPCFTRWNELLDVLDFHLGNTTGRAFWSFNHHLTPTLGWYGRPYLYELVASLPFALGWPLHLLVLVGLTVAVVRHELADRLVLAALLPYFVVVGGAELVFPRYLLPLVPGMVVLASRATCGGWRSRRLSLVVYSAVWLYSLALSASQVARFSVDQQAGVVRWILRARSVAGIGPRVGVPRLAGMRGYSYLAVPLARAGLVYVPLANGHWFDRPVDVLVLPEWKEIEIRRDLPPGGAQRDLERLETGAAGYRFAGRFRSSYLQRDFYTWLDPAFASDLWQGEIGFAIYLREPSADPERR